MAAAPTILWFRRDLRLDDNPALALALERGGPVVPVYVWDPASQSDSAPGGASRAWLHHSLASLDARFRRLGTRLILRRGDTIRALLDLIEETGAGSVVWNRCHEPFFIKRDTGIKESLFAAGLDVRSFNGSLLFTPSRIENKSGQPFKVFTAFWKHCLTLPVRPVIPFGITTWPTLKKRVRSETLDALELRPASDWDSSMLQDWSPGESSAQDRLDHFARELAGNYATDRDRPDRDGTSRLSPHLHWGEISPVQVFHQIRETGAGTDGEVFLSEVGWREFAIHSLFHYPDSVDQPLRPKFRSFPWKENDSDLKTWQRGGTGYPLVDAGLRQLWATGWMHNRVRMVAASFLVKHLLQPWQAGAAWFRETLIDADLANNTLGWQWTAGCGADAAPFFRVFNPIRQGERFDPDGVYVRKWVPELSSLPTPWIHRPFEAPESVLSAAGIRLGREYPRPMVDHAEARIRALAAYGQIRKKS